MAPNRGDIGRIIALIAMLFLAPLHRAPAQEILSENTSRRTLEPGASWTLVSKRLTTGETYRIGISLPSGTLGRKDIIRFELKGPDAFHATKELHAGDPDLYLPYRPAQDGQATVTLTSDGSASPIPIRASLARIALTPEERPAIEAEPNDDATHANPLVLGRDVYGTADDVDYLENKEEGKTGLDFFRLEVASPTPILVYFQLDLLDRDVSANLRCYTVDAAGKLSLFENGKDPMEVVHDRERERYSKHISRVLTKGTYYLEVNANHPDYILRTRELPVPPYDDPSRAVEAGMQYIMNVGDAWFAQIPREGNIYNRASNLHDTATRCTACHASSFPTEANLVAHRNGYPIRAKDGFQYVVDRISNSITPLYGGDGLYWQRFIAIPLQAQGKQGGILADFEREVSGVRTPAVERFGPFLKEAWRGRTTLPADEQNGVVPLDSKFGFAWRDWRVLRELAERTGREDYRDAAANVAKLVGEPAADARVETLQDRIHRLYAWSLIDGEGNAARIRAEAESLLALQNEDGGWHELDAKKGPSAVYTTGQLTWTLLEAGFSRDDPRIAKALRYLLAQQQPFGGWFQTTHENFRTPMRETRFAVEALSRAFPRPALASWGNRDDGPARLPRRDSIVHTLDDLDNLWDIPEADRPRFAREIAALLNDPEPLVRARAAACLGRLGRAEALNPLLSRLADPSKIVWRSAAWAVRRLGNAGVGVDAILASLHHPDPLVRRGAARVFAYQFQGMDTRLDIAGRLMELSADPDLWTRLQALKTLRQWFYRTDNASFQRRIIFCYLSRMAEREVPVIRRNLSEGLYIMLDENLGGGVSLQKNIAELPESMRPGILAARAKFERTALLGPVLSALESGNELQREAILRAFDGSLFDGRFYARRPTGMIDVGNDREFGFLYEPPVELLDRTFAAALRAETRPEVRRQAMLLAGFFNLPGRTEDARIQDALLGGLADANPTVRSAAARVIDDDFAFRNAENRPGTIAAITGLLDKATDGLAPLARALARNSALTAKGEIVAAMERRLKRGDSTAQLAPVLKLPILDDGAVLSALELAYPRTDDAKVRTVLLDVLFSRNTILEAAEPPQAAIDLVRSGATDPYPLVRERTLSGIDKLDTPWSGMLATSLLLTALADDTPALRLLGLRLSASRSKFWARPDTHEHLLHLLADPDPKVRAEALARVEQYRLIASVPRLANRVRALVDEPTLGSRAATALRDQGYDPARLTADVRLSRPRLLRLSTFREKVNPLFYRAGEDGQACVKCHANHTILRIAEPKGPQGVTDDGLMVNYNSAMKVINLGDPESSLLLRKPTSPHGQGGPDAESPTGLTHVGGPRWSDKDDRAYRAILDWIREASTEASASSVERAIAADSYAPGFEPSRAVDGDLVTFWQTEFVGASPGYPHHATIDLGASRRLEGLLYVPRQDQDEGRVRDYQVFVSNDGKTWEATSAKGTWENDPTYKFVPLTGSTARFVRLGGLSEVKSRPFMSAAEIVVESSAAAP